MLPAVALVGRPNVGKSTLFNQLTRTRDALVADFPGLTRDRRYGFAEHDGRRFIVVDTGGLEDTDREIGRLAARQTEIAIAETDLVVLVVDQQEGLTAADERIALTLRAAGKSVIVAVNKSERVSPDLAAAEFHALGLGMPVSIAALHGQGIGSLATTLLERLPATVEPAAPPEADALPLVAVVGRPNVGKSTLINRLIGAERLLTSAEPGTTRDSVHVPCERGSERFVLVDTAGIRRRARVSETVEKFSIVQSLRAIDEAGVVIVLLDAREGITDQDLHLLGLVLERGKALTIGINKWDHLDIERRRDIEGQVERKLQFVAFARLSYVSARHGSGIDGLIGAALAAYRAAGATFPTPRL
ncbi:MAG TPA: ribosome biogenesis GTPase Der, partial [Gammaproteobacteria bacterium]|nr:ribosome biogenesis GTPase Der [Gammaproteobacteria bacterium]